MQLSGVEALLTRKGHQEAFWGDGNFLSLDVHVSMGVFICQIHPTVPLRFMHFSLIKFYLKKL